LPLIVSLKLSRREAGVEGTSFGRYQLISLIGEGGMGKVYKAHDTVIGRDVALKVLPAELGGQPGYRERFRREAQTAARLTEPHIIPIHDTGEVDGHLYLVMPVIDGTDVHTLLKRDGPMTAPQAVRVIEQLAAALDAAHRNGLVHRDIKPSNALMTEQEFVYLIDFGIAHDSAATRLTSTGMMVGTLAYMAPERFNTGSADASSDVYSLACVLYECLTGATPYRGNSVEQQIAGHLTQAPPKPSSASPDIGAGFDDVIATGMAKNPEERYQSATELATAARHALTNKEPPAQPRRVPPAPPQAPRKPPPTAATRPVRQHAPQSRPPVSPPQHPQPAAPAYAAPRSSPPWPFIAAVVAIVAIAIVIIGYLIAKPNSQPANTAQTPTAGPSSVIPPSEPPAQPSAPPTPTGIAGLTPMVGRWTSHVGIVTINADGTGQSTYQDFSSCPSCSRADAPTGTIDFTLTSVANGVASGTITATSNPANDLAKVGEPVSVFLIDGSPSGHLLKLSQGGAGWTYCDSTAEEQDQCGA
jgi:serine/threonine-protein kinase